MQAVINMLSHVGHVSVRPMMKMLPFLLRYLVVVLASCLLAFIISTAHAHAATPAAAVSTAPDRSAPGPYAVKVTEAEWMDKARMREVPVRIVAPQLGKDEAAVPVILFSHGLGGNREGGTLWADHWASYGYLVVQMQHHGSDDGLWKGKSPRELASDMKSGMTLQNLQLRIQDVAFVIDEVQRRAKDKEGPFALADATRIGMSGHSFGAQTTLAVSGQATPSGVTSLEKRISASIAFSPNARNKSNVDKQFGSITLPFFSVTGTKDGEILGDGTKPGDRQIPYQNMPKGDNKGDKYLAVFESGDHMVFGGHNMRMRFSPKRDAEIQAGVKAATLAFWDATLKNDAAARQWLRENFQATLKSGDTFEWK